VLSLVVFLISFIWDMEAFSVACLYRHVVLYGVIFHFLAEVVHQCHCVSPQSVTL